MEHIPVADEQLKTVPVIVGTILGLKNIRRTTGNPGRLSQFKEEWNGVTRQLYIDGEGNVTPLPPSLKINVSVSSPIYIPRFDLLVV